MEFPLNPPGGAMDFAQDYGNFFSKGSLDESALPDLFEESSLGPFNFPDDGVSTLPPSDLSISPASINSVSTYPANSVSVKSTSLDLQELRDFSAEELQDHIEKNYRDLPSSTLLDQPPLFRWLKAPPERVHATSPSKLTDGHRPGGSFSFSVQLVSQCEDGSFIPYKATSDIPLIVNIYGKNKAKSNSSKNIVSSSDLVLLKKNPIGKPLLVVDARPKDLVGTTIRSGDSSATFSGISLTCGSNAARSASAPEAAKDWDWDYFLKVEPSENFTVVCPLLSQHITTDSNRSQTREKKKRDRGHDFELPPAKRSMSEFPIAPYYFQPLPPSTVNSSPQFTLQNANGPFSQFLMASY